MRALILILLITVVATGQHRNTTQYTPLPAPGTAGTVTLTLSEYNRLVELANRKDKLPDDVPLPFVLSRAVFKLRVENQTLVGTVDIDGSLLAKGSVKTPLTTALTILEAKQSGNPLPLLTPPTVKLESKRRSNPAKPRASGGPPARLPHPVHNARCVSSRT